MTYADTYRKVQGVWRIAMTKLQIHFFTPYESGWVKQRMLTA